MDDAAGLFEPETPMAMTKQLAAPYRHQALADDRAVDGHDGSECHAMSLKTKRGPL